jgi:hypothetical protein
MTIPLSRPMSAARADGRPRPARGTSPCFLQARRRSFDFRQSKDSGFQAAVRKLHAAYDVFTYLRPAGPLVPQVIPVPSRGARLPASFRRHFCSVVNRIIPNLCH